MGFINQRPPAHQLQPFSAVNAYAMLRPGRLCGGFSMRARAAAQNGQPGAVGSFGPLS